MRRVPLLVPLALLLALVLLLAGCGGQATAVPSPPAAAPQHARLDWSESVGGPGSRIAFGVRSLQVVRGGWRAELSVTNDTSAAFELGDARASLLGQFGLMLFATGNHGELERRNGDGTLPAVRRAQRFDPPLPALLPAGATWTGTISAAGPLAAGLWVRVVFGALVPVGEMPKSLRDQGVTGPLVWISDHAYELKVPGR